ncbi:MAG TPA: D-alanine--D-alanine ligase [Dysgonomonas sp.]|nr:D-alanine--D-alanine ligase [Dysgonomonas sp.]
MKKNIAVIWGGYSSEKVVSEKSMNDIFSFMDKDRYNVYKVKIDKSEWSADIEGEIYPVDKNDFSIKAGNQKIKIDFAYITIHGTPGEDGRLQGYFDMLGIPYSSCGFMASALTFNKFFCTNYLKNFGINVAKSIYITKDTKYNVEYIAEELKFPIFIKPNTGGSSFATTKVKSADKIQEAIDTAFSEGPDVIVESFISGREVTCGCYKTKDKAVILPITEVVTQNEFFDYDAKYKGQVEEITPADLPGEITVEIGRLTSCIYDLVGAKGLIRVDFIITAEGVPFLLEVNTTPGMTSTSFIPQQVRAAGLSMTDVLTEIIENEYEKIHTDL